jgi:hypothetical protein
MRQLEYELATMQKKQKASADAWTVLWVVLVVTLLVGLIL